MYFSGQDVQLRFTYSVRDIIGAAAFQNLTTLNASGEVPQRGVDSNSRSRAS